jgi:Ca2+-binding EF-hand superfamily protein
MDHVEMIPKLSKSDIITLKPDIKRFGEIASIYFSVNGGLERHIEEFTNDWKWKKYRIYISFIRENDNSDSVLTPEEADGIWHSYAPMDADGDENIAIAEMMSSVSMSKWLYDALKGTNNGSFAELDLDGTGIVDKDEFADGMNKAVSSIQPARWMEMSASDFRQFLESNTFIVKSTEYVDPHVMKPFASTYPDRYAERQAQQMVETDNRKIAWSTWNMNNDRYLDFDEAYAGAFEDAILRLRENNIPASYKNAVIGTMALQRLKSQMLPWDTNLDGRLDYDEVSKTDKSFDGDHPLGQTEFKVTDSLRGPTCDAQVALSSHGTEIGTWSVMLGVCID